MKHDLTQGNILRSIILFTLPLLIGNLMQQAYNLVDTYVVGMALGSNALASVGSCYTLMTFLISILTGLCMGSSALVSIYFGKKDWNVLHQRMSTSFICIGFFSIVLQIFCILNIDFLLNLLHTPSSIFMMTKEYLSILFYGIFFLFLFNFFAYMTRSLGNSMISLIFLSISTLINIICDFLFVFNFHMGIQGAAYATLLAQFFSALCMTIYCIKIEKIFSFSFQFNGIKEIVSNSLGACIQQSIMNFGILLIQSLVNTFGPVVMAAFTIGVKIDTLAYMPLQEFGNAFSTFTGQNYGACQYKRMEEGKKKALQMIIPFSLLTSLCIVFFSECLIHIFSNDLEVISIGSEYLKMEGNFYIGIGLLFFLYGYFRAIKKPSVSILLTIISLGLRVVISYCLSPVFGYTIIWLSIPIGWTTADLAGFLLLKQLKPG